MTSRTSLFNKGIYKSTLKRCLWGSVLYFVILFLTTVMPIFLAYDRGRVIGYSGRPILLDDMLIPSLLLAVVVPTIVGLLVLRFMHSKKTTVFTHSLPVCRTAIFVSSVAAGLSLMITPVILTAVVLGIMSLSGYSALFGLGSVLCWLLINLLTLFTMFACTCFVSSLTGNSFAVVALNILFHTVIVLLALTFGVFAQTFLFGFDNIADIMSRVADTNLVYRIFDRAAGFYNGFEHGIPAFDIGNLWEILSAVALYILAGFLYSRRNLENAEDVAGFKILNPIFKYLITFLAACSTFAMLSYYINKNIALFIFMISVVSAVAYFATEMVLKKTLKVFGGYKGYLAFVAIFAAMTLVFAFTGFFGYESRVPDVADIESATIYNYYHSIDEPFVEDKKVIEHITQIHSGLVADEKIYIIRPDDYVSYQTRIHVKYKLKNGKTMNRVYYISEVERFRIIEQLYEHNSYRSECEPIVSAKTDDIYRISIYTSTGDNHTIIGDVDEVEALKNAVVKDLTSLKYNQIYTDTGSAHITFEMRYPEDVNREYEHMTLFVDVNANSNFKNTHKWLNENGYSHLSYYTKVEGIVHIAKNEKIKETGHRLDYISENAEKLTSADLPDKSVFLGEQEQLKLEEYLKDNFITASAEEKIYNVFYKTAGSGYETLAEFTEEELRAVLEYIFR